MVNNEKSDNLFIYYCFGDTFLFVLTIHLDVPRLPRNVGIDGCYILKKLARQKTIAGKKTITGPSSLASINFLAIGITIHSYALVRGE
jgi:hypothetical protein